MRSCADSDWRPTVTEWGEKARKRLTAYLYGSGLRTSVHSQDIASALEEIERLKVQYNGCNEERISAQNRADAHWDKLYQAEQRIRELETALRKAEHSRSCKRQTMFDPPELCDCGIHAALSSEGEGREICRPVSVGGARTALVQRDEEWQREANVVLGRRDNMIACLFERIRELEQRLESMDRLATALSFEGEGNPKLPEAWKCKACGYQTAEDPCGNCGAKKGTVFRRHPERVFGEGEEE
jgi:rubrerythrin